MTFLKKPLPILGLIILGYAIIHVPLIFSGFGEPDGWRTGLAALGWGKGLGYEPSRFPGFPVVELTYGVIAEFSPWESLWIYTNLSTLILTLVGIYFYYQIVLYHKISHPLTTVLLLYFIPAVFVNASSSMDYLWTITFILIAYWSLLQKRPTIGGIFLGFSIGARLTTGIFLLPFLLFLVLNPKIFPQKNAIRNIIRFVSSALIISVICYSPLIIKYYLGFLNTLYPHRDFLRSGYYVMQMIFGLPGSICLIVFIVIKRKGLIQWNWELSLWGLIIAAYLILFLVKPEKVEYLMPMFPFAVLWIARWLNRKNITIFTSLVIFNNILSFLVFQPEPEGLKMNWIAKGITYQKYVSYQNYLQDTRFLIQYPYLPDSVVVVAWREAGVGYLLELPFYQARKDELLKNRIVFSHNSGKQWRKNTYLVQGSHREKRGDPSLGNVVIVYPPSTL